MTKQQWPAGVRPWGDGIQIRLWKRGKEIYSETLDGNPYKKRDLAAAVKRRDQLKSRLQLGLSVYNADTDAVTSFFKEAAQDYLNNLEADYSTHLSYEGIINKYWIPPFSKWLIQDIKVRHIKQELAT